MKLVFLIIIFLLPLCVNSQVINRGAAGYFSFNDSTVNDKSGNGFHGIAENIAYTDGVILSSAEFQSENSIIKIPDFTISNQNDFTICLWVKTENIQSANGTGYFCLGDFSTGWTGIFHSRDNNDTTGNSDYICFSIGGIGIDNRLKFKVMPDDWNEWTFYCLIYQNGIIHAYKNNQLLDVRTGDFDITSGLATVGGYCENGIQKSGFIGYIDEVRIYNRAITENEYRYLYFGSGDNSFEYRNFNSDYGLIKIGSAQAKERRMFLTESVPQQAGAIWFKEKALYTNGFLADFAFRIFEGVTGDVDDGSLPGGDGFAFVIQNYSDSAIGTASEGLGFVNIPNSIAIEFDFFRNDSRTVDKNDPNGNHIAVFSKGSAPNNNNHSGDEYLGGNEAIQTIEPGGKIYYAQIEYRVDKSKLRIYLDTNHSFTNPVLEIDNLDFEQLLKSNGDYAYFGFTASTGKSYQTHEILNWYFYTLPKYDFLNVDDSMNKPIADNDNIVIFPNPFTDEIQISLHDKASNLDDVRVYNSLGKEIDRLNLGKTNRRHKLNSSKYPAGVYFFCINSNKGIICKTAIKIK